MSEIERDVSDGNSVVVTQRIAASPDAVFPFLIDPEKLTRWLGSEARLEPAPGGEFWVRVHESDIAVGRFTEVSPPERVVFTWGWEGSSDVPPGSTTVTIMLASDGDGTLVELRHDGLSSEMQTEHRTGWQHFVPILVDVASGR